MFLGGTPVRRPFEQVAADIDEMQALLALLELNLRNRRNTPSTRGYPPRLFVPYRRDSDDSIGWCRGLAEGLQQRGYEVDLDVLGIAREAGPEDVSSFIGLHGDIRAGSHRLSVVRLYVGRTAR